MVFLLGSVAAQSPISNRDVVRFGNDITVAENKVVKDVTAIAGSVIILNKARVTGDAVAVGGDVTNHLKAFKLRNSNRRKSLI